MPILSQIVRVAACAAAVGQLVIAEGRAQDAASLIPGVPMLAAVDPALWEADPTLEAAPETEIEPETAATEPEQETGWSGGLLTDAQTEDVGTLPQDAGDSKPGFALRVGSLELRPHATAGITYDDNIFVSERNPKEDIVYTLSPGLTLGLGDYLERKGTFASLDYTPTLILFQDHSEQNALDHQLQLAGQHFFSKLTLGGSLGFEKLSGAERDVADRVDRSVYTAILEGSYRLSDRTSVDADGVFSARDYENQIDSTELVNHNWVSYALTPKVNVALGAAFGVLRPDFAEGDQTYQQALLRLRYESTAKVSFDGNAGVELRQFESEESDRITPVFGLGLRYAASESTSLSLSGSRRVSSSATLAGENYVTTGLSAGLEQHLWRDLYFNLDGGYEHADYDRAGPGGTGDRSDDYFFVRPRLTYSLREWLALSAFYLYRENDSSAADRSFRNNQVGLELSLTF